VRFILHGPANFRINWRYLHLVLDGFDLSSGVAVCKSAIFSGDSSGNKFLLLKNSIYRKNRDLFEIG